MIGTKIGSNDLKVVFKNGDYFKKYQLLTPEVLANIVQDTNVTVYTTSNNNGNRGISGTFQRYKEILLDFVNLEKIHCEEFISNQVFSSFNDRNPFVILETSTFTVDTNDISADWFSLPIYYDSTKKTKIQNDLYIYFVAHKKQEGAIAECYVPEQVRNFLEIIGDTLPDDKDLRFTKDKIIQEYSVDGKFIPYENPKGSLPKILP